MPQRVRPLTSNSSRAKTNPLFGDYFNKNICCRVLVFLFLFIGLSNKAIAQSEEYAFDADQMIFLPVGSARHGEKAFERLKCFTCHKVPGSSFPDPINPDLAPSLGALQASYPAGWIAQQVLLTMHAPENGGARDFWEDDPVSVMGDFSYVMTVRELTDIVAYIKSLQGPQEEGT